MRRGWSWAVALALMALYFAQAYASSLHKSLTWDEPTTLGGGYAILAWRDYDVYLESPPLMQVLSAWGLYRAGPREPEREAWLENPNPKVQLGVELTFHGGVDFQEVTRRARLPVIVTGTLLVGLLFLWGRALFGAAPALAPATLAAFEPNLIAHGRVATADMGVTLLMCAAVASFWWAARGEAPPGARSGTVRWIVCGAVTALALLAKFTALLLGPIYVLLTLALWRLRPTTRALHWVLQAALPIGLICWAGVAAAYGFDWDLSLYREGVARIYSDHSPDRYQYLLGRASPEPFWYYYPVAYALKAPIAVLIFQAAAFLWLARSGWNALRSGSDTGRRRDDLEAAVFLLTPAAVMVGVALFDASNLGVRRILPAVPFLLLITGFVFREAAVRGGAARWAAGVLVAGAVAAGLAIYPHHLSFINAAAGGPERGPYLLDESNVDWGQDLPALAAWQRTRPPDELPRIKYFGTADGAAYGVRGIPMEDEEWVRPRPGVYVISAHYLAGVRKLRAAGWPAPDWLTEFHPSARIAYSLYVYEFEPPPP